MNSTRKEQMCECGHSRKEHNIDSFNRLVCDHAKDYPDGTYEFDCMCVEFREKIK